MNTTHASAMVAADDAWAALVDAASAPYRRAGRFAWFFARGKLRFDPVFRHLLEAGLVQPGERVLDIGCGQGLLASLLASAGAFGRAGRWPSDWPAAPHGTRVVGIEFMQRDIERARGALGETTGAASFVCGDMREVAFPKTDVVAILDVLHYIDHAAQDAVLRRVREALADGGRLVLRVGDRSSRRRFVITQWVDHAVTTLRRNPLPPTYCRPLAAWRDALHSLGFAVTSRPMHHGTPFANVLLVGSVPAGARP